MAVNRKRSPAGLEGSGRRSLPKQGDTGKAPKGESLERSRPVAGWATPGQDFESDTMAIDPDELRDFLSADRAAVDADPIFRERLREKLWKIVEQRYGVAGDEVDPADDPKDA